MKILTQLIAVILPVFISVSSAYAVDNIVTECDSASCVISWNEDLTGRNWVVSAGQYVGSQEIYSSGQIDRSIHSIDIGAVAPGNFNVRIVDITQSYEWLAEDYSVTSVVGYIDDDVSDDDEEEDDENETIDDAEFAASLTELNGNMELVIKIITALGALMLLFHGFNTGMHR